MLHIFTESVFQILFFWTAADVFIANNSSQGLWKALVFIDT